MTDVEELKRLLGPDVPARVSSLIATATASGALVSMRTDACTVTVDDLPPFLLRLFVPAEHRVTVRNTIHTGSAAASRAVSPFVDPDPALLVSAALPQHNVLLNKFPVVPRHLLLCTKAYADQREHLTPADCAALEALAACAFADGDGSGGALCFYNCGEDSGASQGHKHMQLVPRTAPHPYFLDTLIARATAAERDAGRLACFDFAHAFVGLDRTRPGHLHGAYTGLLRTLGIAPGTPHTSYNLLCTADWLFVVPRRAECWAGVLPTDPPCPVRTSVNSLGFAGSILVREEAAYRYLHTVGPLPVLRAITFPASAASPSSQQ